MMSGLKKYRVKYEALKEAGPIIQGIVKNQLELLEVGNAYLYPHICSLHYEPTVEFLRMKYLKGLDSTTIKTRGPG